MFCMFQVMGSAALLGGIINLVRRSDYLCRNRRGVGTARDLTGKDFLNRWILKELYLELYLDIE